MSNDTPSRRDFLKTAAASLLVLITEEEAIRGAMRQDEKPVGPPVKFGVIGLGQWGKEILATLARSQAAQVTAISDTYELALTKGKEIAPKAATFTDYRKLIESVDVEAIIIATPTPQHKEMALAALQAGKHVYCEAPMATTVEDAKAIARAARDAVGQVFQPGLSLRPDRQDSHGPRAVAQKTELAFCLGQPRSREGNQLAPLQRTFPRTRRGNWH